jgi:uncharacterized membrane protein YeiH
MTPVIATMTPVIYKFGIWTLGTVGIFDLIAASTNAFNGALLARRPDHYRHFTVAGVILLAYAGGIGGGVLRDVLANKVPSPLVNPWYLIACLAAAILAIVIEFNSGQKFKDGLFQFMTAFSLPWYAIVGAQVAVSVHLGYLAAVLIGVIATTGGRFIIDIACGVIPKLFVRGEFFIGTAAATAALYLVLNEALGLSVVVSTILAFFFGFGFRLLAQYFGWEEWEPWEPPELKAGEKARKTLGEGLHGEFEPEANAAKEP